MAAKVIDATDHGPQGVTFVVLTDETRMLENGTPDPAACRSYTFGSFDSSGNPKEKRADYLQRMKGEALLLAEDAAAREPKTLTDLID